MNPTPGPWEMGTLKEGGELGYVGRVPIWAASEAIAIVERRSDARAMAAAPELLEALIEVRQCLNAITAPGEFKEELDRARAAIAKARGI